MKTRRSAKLERGEEDQLRPPARYSPEPEEPKQKPKPRRGRKPSAKAEAQEPPHGHPQEALEEAKPPKKRLLKKAAAQDAQDAAAPAAVHDLPAPGGPGFVPPPAHHQQQQPAPAAAYHPMAQASDDWVPGAEEGSDDDFAPEAEYKPAGRGRGRSAGRGAGGAGKRRAKREASESDYEFDEAEAAAEDKPKKKRAAKKGKKELKEVKAPSRVWEEAAMLPPSAAYNLEDPYQNVALPDKMDQQVKHTCLNRKRSAGVYVPGFKTGGFGILVTLYRECFVKNPRIFQPNQGIPASRLRQLCEDSGLCDASYCEPSDPSRNFTAWDSKKTPDKEGYLDEEWGRDPHTGGRCKFIRLSPVGIPIARSLYALALEEGLFDRPGPDEGAAAAAAAAADPPNPRPIGQAATPGRNPRAGAAFLGPATGPMSPNMGAAAVTQGLPLAPFSPASIPQTPPSRPHSQAEAVQGVV